jgi:FlaG/FlaF family flagellin (archaellin)
MRSVPVILGALALVAAVPAQADRQVTDDERAKLVDAVSAERCSGGEMEFDGTKFEVEAQCNDGQRYDLEFDASYRLITKKLED